MKKYIRLTAVIIILALSVVFVSGCGGNSNTAENQLKGLDQLDVKNLKEVTLTFYLPGEEEKPDAKKVLGEIEKKVKDKLNIKLDFKWCPVNDYFPQVKGMLGTDQVIDGFYYIAPNSYWNYNDEVNSGKIADLTKLLPKYAPNLYKQFTKEEIEGSMVDGKLVAVPKRFQTINPDYAVVREDLMEKYKIPAIKTLDDYTTYMKTINENEKGMIPGNSFVDSLNMFTRANDYIILDRYQRLVYKKNDPKMKILAWERTPEFAKFINYFSDWRAKGYLDNININYYDQSTIYNDTINKLLSGKLASVMGNLGTAETLNSRVKATKNSNWKFKGYLLYPDKKMQRESPIDGSIAFNASSPNIERSLMFLEWLNSSQENYDLFMYGIEGEHYTLKGKQIKRILNSDGNNTYIDWGGSDAFQNVDYERVSADLPEDMIKTYFDLYNKDSEYPPHLGYSLSYTGVETEAEARLMEYGSDIDQPFINGTLDKASFKQALDYLKQVDTDKIIISMQNSLDSWRKANKN